MTFDFDIILGSFLTFRGPNGLFLGFLNCFWVSSYRLMTIFLSFALFLLYYVVLSLWWWCSQQLLCLNPTTVMVVVVVVVGL